MISAADRLCCRLWIPRGALPLLAALLLLCACGGERIESFGGPTMGSAYSVKYVRGADGPSVDAARAEVEGILAEIDRQMSTYRDDSLVSRFNALDQGCMALPEPMLALLDDGLRLSAQSGGAFDLTIMPLTELWGFGAQTRPERIPSGAQLDEAMRYVGYRHLRREGGKVCKDAPVRISFDSIAAGYAVDRVAERLQRLGVTSYMVEITGELKAAGRKPDGTPWRIAVEAPRDGERVAQTVIALNGYGVSTSGDYRNYFEENGRRYSHTFDARSGRPVAHELAAVTVIDRSAQRADGLSTLLMVLGPKEGYAFALAHDVAALFVARERERFETYVTPEYRRLFGDPS